MKIIRIELNKSERAELLKIAHNSKDKRQIRALAVLQCAEGKRAKAIAEDLKRSSQAICSWLNAYISHGVMGLVRNYSPGRPSKRRTKLAPKLETYLSKSPRDFGWGEDLWSVKVIQAQYKKEHNEPISRHTVIRALKDANYSPKRSKKTMPINAPSKEEKLERVKEIAEQISNLQVDNKTVEVMFVDESHFSTEPYVARGWSKRGAPFFPQDTEQTRKLLSAWCIRIDKRRILLEVYEEE